MGYLMANEIRVASIFSRKQILQNQIFKKTNPTKPKANAEAMNSNPAPTYWLSVEALIAKIRLRKPTRVEPHKATLFSILTSREIKLF
jgi:hypothetical protein